jgi:hypothetical protein
MGNVALSRPGSKNGGVDPKEMFAMKYLAEVMTAYNRKTVMRGRTLTRTIESGTGAKFPATWKAAAYYHTAGEELTGQSILSGERTINVDNLLVSPVYIASIDEAMSHFSFRRIYSYQCGEALAQTLDRNLLQVACLAARATATITGANGGTVIESADADSSAVDAFVAACAAAGQAFDEKDVPEETRTVFVKPGLYRKLISSDNPALNRDFNPDNGSISKGRIFECHGFEIVKTNNLPSTDISTGPSAYQGDFTKTRAVFTHRDAIGTVELVGMEVEMDYLLQNKATLVVASMAVGHGILRPECSVEYRLL